MELIDYMLSVIRSFDFSIAVIGGFVVAGGIAACKHIVSRKRRTPCDNPPKDGMSNNAEIANLSGHDNAITLVNSQVQLSSVNQYPSGFHSSEMQRQPPSNLSIAIAARLRQAIDAVNYCPMFSRTIDIPYIARTICHDDDFGKVEQYLDGTAVQSFNFINEISEYFGVSRTWLESGEGAPFPLRYVSSPLDCLPIIKEQRPLSVFFVLDDSERRQAVLVLAITEYRYLTVGNGDWPLAIRTSTGTYNVGGGGRSNIIEFYELVKKVYELRNTRGYGSDKQYLSLISDIIIPKEDMGKLVNGSVHPKSIIYKHGFPGNTYWADDMRDLDGRCCGGRDKYEEMHGTWFIETQEHIKKSTRSHTVTG